MDKDEQHDLPTAPEVKAPKKVPVAVSAPEVAPESEVMEPAIKAVDPQSPPEPEQTVGTAQAVPQLIRGTESTKPEEPEVGTDGEQLADPTSEAEPEHVWTEQDEAGKQYDSGRGDYVDHLNDTTPPPPAPSKPKKKKSGKGWIWLLVILLVVAAGVGAYLLFGSKKAAAPQPTTSSTQPSTQKKAEQTETAPKITTKHYDSTTYAMGLDYPDTWKVNDTPTLLSVTSPQMSLKANDGTKTHGYIFVTIQPKQSTLPDFAKGSAVAVLQSEKITYKKPTQNQRAQTYVTFASYASTTGKGLDALYVTGNNGYQVDQDIPMSDIIQTDPLVTVKFLTCSSQTCTGTTKALSVDSSEWKNTAVSAPINTILESFTFE
ncbi:hypothetical protein EYC59_00730 [Candidatus Saccharibacteria bacterium]|nr:MAG: hypothetical protein EYC59_00730 [Candidatus Saccharibacteria bacterium]